MLYVKIDREASKSLSNQIYESIKESILDGTLKAHEKLPSSRELSAELNISRNVIMIAYEQLTAEGYIYTRYGSGTFICEGVVLKKNNNPIKTNFNLVEPVKSSQIICFRTGIGDLSKIPIKKWAKLYHSIALDVAASKLDYQKSFGDDGLRMELASYLNRVRKTNINYKNIIITNGAAQSFNILCKLVSENEYALVENPLSYGLLHTLRSNEIKIRSIEIDLSGMITKNLPKNPPKLIFTTPTHQFPTGTILPAFRRIELIQYARKNNCYIVEDDYDSMFRFDGDPIEPIQNMAADRVIYVGTFSKIFMPALRIGYMVIPDEIFPLMQEAKYVSDIHSSIMEQLTLAEFIRCGALEQHIQKMKKCYRKKRNFLIQCLKKEFGDKVMISGVNTGLHFVAHFKDVIFDEERMKCIKESGIEIDCLMKYLTDKEKASQFENALVFGYGNTKIEQMENGIAKLHSLLQKN